MSKLVLSMRVSLDGLVARPERLRAGGWGLPPDDPSLNVMKEGRLASCPLGVQEVGPPDRTAGEARAVAAARPA
jgi:hypothetical protein